LTHPPPFPLECPLSPSVLKPHPSSPGMFPLPTLYSLSPLSPIVGEPVTPLAPPLSPSYEGPRMRVLVDWPAFAKAVRAGFLFKKAAFKTTLVPFLSNRQVFDFPSTAGSFLFFSLSLFPYYLLFGFFHFSFYPFYIAFRDFLVHQLYSLRPTPAPWLSTFDPFFFSFCFFPFHSGERVSGKTSLS